MKKKINKKLKSCPHCGSGAYFEFYEAGWSVDHPHYGVLDFCANKNCAASVCGRSKKEAAAIWNRRVKPSDPSTAKAIDLLTEARDVLGETVADLRKEIERLKAENAELVATAKTNSFIDRIEEEGRGS